jgi:hypothetical protein
MDVSLDGHVVNGRDAADLPADFSELFLATSTSKTTSDDAPVDWPQLLAIMCEEHPEAVQWFAEMGGFQPDFDQLQMAVPQNEHDLTQSQFSAIYPHQQSITLSHFLPSFNNSSSISVAAPAATPASLRGSTATSIPLHHPRPVRPIPQIPLRDLAAVALRLGKPRGPREPTDSLSSLPLLCQPVGDAVRYHQQKPFSGGEVYADPSSMH